MVCPYCQTGVKESEAKLCPICGMPHHAECWQENGGCTVYGCTGKVQAERPPLVVNIPALSGASDEYSDVWWERRQNEARRQAEEYSRDYWFNYHQRAEERMKAEHPPMAFFYGVAMLFSLGYLWKLFQCVCDTSLVFNREWMVSTVLAGVLATLAAVSSWGMSYDAWPPRKDCDHIVFFCIILFDLVMLITIAAKGGLLQ